MTIASTLTQRQYTGTGTGAQFSFPNKIFSASDLVITIYDTSGNVYPFVNFANATLGWTYSVQNVDVDTGCIVVLSNVLTSGWVLDIRSLIPELQSTSVKNQGQFLPELHEESFDRATRMIQDLLRLTYTFGIHGPDSEFTSWPALPIASLRKGYALMFDAVTGLPGLGFLSAQNVTQGLLGPILNPQTSAESNAGVVPVNQVYLVYNVKRYGAIGNGVADDTAAIQTALNLAGFNNFTSVYFPTGIYKVSSTLVIPGNNITLYGEGIWASQINCAITGNPANPLFSWTANAGGTTGQFLQVQGLRFNGNGLTGASGNGHAFALLGALGVTFANFSTFRDCFFVSFLGNGKNSAGSSIAAAGVYCYFGNVLKVENCIFEACNDGVTIDGNIGNPTAKVCISACTFDNLTNIGVHAIFVQNLLVNNQTIFNNMLNGVSLGFAQETTTVDDCRFKIMSGPAISAGGTNLIDQLNITNNYFYTTFQSSPNGVITVGSNVEGVNIQGNELLFDSLVVNGLGILFQNPASFNGNSFNVIANRFVVAASATISSLVRANNATDAMNSMVIMGNYFGQQATPSFAYTITDVIALTGAGGGIGTLIANNTFFTAAPGVITNAVHQGAGWNGTFLLNNTYSGVTNNLVNAGINLMKFEGGTFVVPTISTGWGTATGTGVLINFSGAGATLAQTSQTVATLINLLKQQGTLGT